MYSTDITLVCIPKLKVKGPLLALTQLQACIKQAGFVSSAYDFNIWFYNKTIDTDLNYIWKVLDNTLITDKIENIKYDYIKFWNIFFDEIVQKDNTNLS